MALARRPPPKNIEQTINLIINLKVLRMKRINYLLLGAAGLLLASCSQEEVTPPATGDGNFNVTVKLPGDMATRAMSDGLTANTLKYAVYDASDDMLVFQGQTGFNNSLETTVSMNLANGKSYKVAFFAQSPYSITQGVYNFDAANAQFTVNYDAMTNSGNNADDYDCFYNLYTTQVIGTETENVTVILTRPVAQINWGADDFKNGSDATALTHAFGANGAYLTATLTTQAYNTFSLLDNDVDTSAGLVDVNLANFTAPNAVFPVDVVDGVSPYDYVAMQMLLAPKTSTVYDLNLTIDNSKNPNAGAEVVAYDVNVASAPVQANFRTNIYGTLLSDNIVFTVKKDPNWAGDINIPYGYEVEGTDGLYLQDKTYTITSPAGLVAYSKIANQATQQGMSGYTVLLAADLDMSTVTNYVPFSNAGATFDGQGHTVYNLTVNTTANGNASAGFMSSAIGSVSNLNFVNANIAGNFKAGVLAGDGLCARIENVTVQGATVVSTPWMTNGNYDDGNNVGGLVGYLSAEPEAWIKGCSVSDATVKGYRQVGGLVGRVSKDNAQVTGNTVSNTTVIGDLTHNYNNLTPSTADVGEIYGGTANGTPTLTPNTATNVNILYIEENGTIEVSSLENLQAIAGMGSSFYQNKTITFESATTIDFKGAMLQPIDFGYSGDFHNCTIDGNGVTLKNFTIQGTGNNTGVFSEFTGLIKNFNIDGMTLVGGGENTGFVGYLNGAMENVNISNSNITGSNINTGSLVGLFPGNSGSYMKNCKATGCTVKGTKGVGALAGTANDGTTRIFTSCTVEGCTVEGTEDVGSIVGWALVPTQFDSCTVTGTTVNGVEVSTPGNLQ